MQICLNGNFYGGLPVPHGVSWAVVAATSEPVQPPPSGENAAGAVEGADPADPSKPGSQDSSFRFDVFVSYNRADEVWVEELLLPRLKEAGLRVSAGDQDFVVGGSRRRNLRVMVQESKHTIAVLSPAFVEDNWAGFTAMLAGDSDPMALELKLLPIVIEPCELPDVIADLSLFNLDFTDPRHQERNFQRLIEAINPSTRSRWRNLLRPRPAWFHPLRKVAAMSLAILILLAVILVILLPVLFRSLPPKTQDNLVGLVFTLTPTPTVTATPQATPTATPTPMAGRGFNLAVAQFTANSPDSPPVSKESRELSEWLFFAVTKGLEDLPPELRVEIRGPEHVEPVLHDPAVVAKRHNATLLIYGTVTGTNDDYHVQPEFYVSWQSFNYGGELTGPNRLGQPVAFNLPLDDPETLLGVNKALNARVRALQQIVIGLADLYTGLPGDAWLKFERAANIPGWAEQEGKEVIYLLMGAAKLLESDNLKLELEKRSQALDEAAQAFEQARQLNQDYARSYLGLGAVAIQQATILNNQGTVEGVYPDKLDEALSWYSNSQRAVDRPPKAYVSIKAAHGLGQTHLVGYEFNLPNWSNQEARTYFDQVIAAYDPKNAAELTWFVGDAQAMICRLEGLDEAWAAMASRCRQAIEILETLPYPTRRDKGAIARYWTWVAYAEVQQNRVPEAVYAYGEAIRSGEGYILEEELNVWQNTLDCLKQIRSTGGSSQTTVEEAAGCLP